MSTTGVPSKRKRRLSPTEKYELFVSVLTGQATQREAAETYGDNRRRDFLPTAGSDTIPSPLPGQAHRTLAGYFRPQVSHEL